MWSNHPYFPEILRPSMTRTTLLLLCMTLPLAWLLANSWLQGFAYRISPGVGTFGLGLLIPLAIAGSAIGSQTLKAAQANPIDHLHDE
jgi:putative ABC transport system permease protein